MHSDSLVVRSLQTSSKSLPVILPKLPKLIIKQGIYQSYQTCQSENSLPEFDGIGTAQPNQMQKYQSYQGTTVLSEFDWIRQILPMGIIFAILGFSISIDRVWSPQRREQPSSVV